MNFVFVLLSGTGFFQVWAHAAPLQLEFALVHHNRIPDISLVPDLVKLVDLADVFKQLRQLLQTLLGPAVLLKDLLLAIEYVFAAQLRDFLDPQFLVFEVHRFCLVALQPLLQILLVPLASSHHLLGLLLRQLLILKRTLVFHLEVL